MFIKLLSKAKKKSKKVNSTITSKSDPEYIKDSQKLINTAKNKGIDTTKAEDLLQEARNAYALKSPQTSKALARKAKREIREKINARDKGRSRVIFSETALNRSREKAKIASKELGLESEDSEGLKILKKAEESRKEGKYSLSEGLAWKGEKILEEEIETQYFSNELQELIETAGDLLDFLERYDLDIDDLMKIYESAVESYKDQEYSETLSYLKGLFKNISMMINEEKVQEITDLFTGFGVPESERKELENRFQEAHSDLEDIEPISNHAQARIYFLHAKASLFEGDVDKAEGYLNRVEKSLSEGLNTPLPISKFLDLLINRIEQDVETLAIEDEEIQDRFYNKIEDTKKLINNKKVEEAFENIYEIQKDFSSIEREKKKRENRINQKEIDKIKNIVEDIETERKSVSHPEMVTNLLELFSIHIPEESKEDIDKIYSNLSDDQKERNKTLKRSLNKMSNINNKYGLELPSSEIKKIEKLIDNKKDKKAAYQLLLLRNKMIKYSFEAINSLEEKMDSLGQKFEENIETISELEDRYTEKMETMSELERGYKEEMGAISDVTEEIEEKTQPREKSVEIERKSCVHTEEDEEKEEIETVVRHEESKKIIDGFSSISNVDVDGKISSSKPLIFQQPLTERDFKNDLCVVKWNKYSDNQLSELLSAIKRYCEIVDSDHIVLLKEIDFKEKAPKLIFSSPGKKYLTKLLSDSVLEKSYFDTNNRFKSILTNRLDKELSENVRILDITLNKRSDGKLLDRVVEHITS